MTVTKIKQMLELVSTSGHEKIMVLEYVYSFNKYLLSTYVVGTVLGLSCL